MLFPFSSPRRMRKSHIQTAASSSMMMTIYRLSIGSLDSGFLQVQTLPAGLGTPSTVRLVASNGLFYIGSRHYLITALQARGCRADTLDTLKEAPLRAIHSGPIMVRLSTLTSQNCNCTFVNMSVCGRYARREAVENEKKYPSFLRRNLCLGKRNKRALI